MVLTRKSVRKLEKPSICWAIKICLLLLCSLKFIHPEGVAVRQILARPHRLKKNRLWTKEVFYWLLKSLKAEQNSCGPSSMRNRLFSRATFLLIQLVQSQSFLGQCLWAVKSPPGGLNSLKCWKLSKLPHGGTWGSRRGPRAPKAWFITESFI